MTGPRPVPDGGPSKAERQERSRAAEETVLGHLIRRTDTPLPEGLRPYHFTVAQHGRLYDAILAGRENGGHPDAAQLRESDHGRLNELSDGVVTSQDPEENGRRVEWHAARIVRNYHERAATSEVIDAADRFERGVITVGAFRKHLDAVQDRLDTTVPSSTVLDLSDVLSKPIPRLDYLVDQWIAAEEFHILAAPPKGLKSYLALDAALALATGGEWLGHFTTGPARVLYADMENSRHIVAERLHRLCKSRGITASDERLRNLRYILRGAFNFDTDSTGPLASEISTFRPKLVVLDSMVRFHCKDENSNSEMARWFAENVAPLRALSAAAWLVLHHHGKGGGDNQQRIRGASDIAAYCDSYLTISRKPTGFHLEAEGRHGARDPLLVSADFTDDGASLTAGTLTRHAYDRIRDALDEAGAGGLLRSDLVTMLAEAGLTGSSAERLVTKHTKEMERRGEAVSNNKKPIRWWLKIHAPSES